MIHVLAELRVHEGKREQLIDDLRRLEPEVRAEPGCIEYAGAIDVPTGLAVQAPLRPDVVMVIEKWESVEALAAHGDAPHMHAHRARMRDVIAGVAIHVLEASA